MGKARLTLEEVKQFPTLRKLVDGSEGRNTEEWGMCKNNEGFDIFKCSSNENYVLKRYTLNSFSPTKKEDTIINDSTNLRLGSFTFNAKKRSDRTHVMTKVYGDSRDLLTSYSDFYIF